MEPDRNVWQPEHLPECLEISPVLLERFKHPPNVLVGGMSFLLHFALSLSLSLALALALMIEKYVSFNH